MNRDFVAIPAAARLDAGAGHHLLYLLVGRQRLELDVGLVRLARLDLDRACRQLQVEANGARRGERLAPHHT